TVEWYLQNDIESAGTHRFVLEHYLNVFTTILAVLCQQNKKVRVLDFGGGMGNTYVPVIASLKTQVDIEYHIVDTPGNCASGKKIFTKEDAPFFYENIPEIEVDLVLTSSTIQY